MDINQRLTEELDVKRWQIDAAVQLIDEGNTIPFISRYRNVLPIPRAASRISSSTPVIPV